MKKQPAILLISSDELLYSTLSFYGNRAIQTPNIDRLAETGTEFSRAYTVSPWCLPARCAALTGKYPHKNRAYSNFRECKVGAGEKTLFSELRQAGYHTTMFGKCHFIPVPYGRAKPDRTQRLDDLKDYYLSLGLDHLTLQDGNQVSAWFYDDFSIELEEKGLLADYRSGQFVRENQLVYTYNLPTAYHPDVWVADKAREYIAQYDADRPFFSWISFSGPHYPMNSPQEYIDRVDADKLPAYKFREGELSGTDRIQHASYYGHGHIDGCGPAPDNACGKYTEAYWKRMLTNYHANVKLIDDKIGEILETATQKFGEELMVIFTADHGEMLRNHGIWGKNNCIYDEVWRIPLFVKLPKQTAHKADARLANTLDILPTCLEMAGAEPDCDGVSLLRENDRSYTFSEGEGFIAVTDGHYKYAHIHKGQEDFRELIDTDNDPNEFENKISDPAYAGVVSALREQIIEHFLPEVLR